MEDREFAAARRRLTDRLVAALVALWSARASWHKSDVPDFLADAVPLVQAAQRTLADLVAAQVADHASEALSRPVSVPLLPDEDVTDLRAGTSVDEAYSRVFGEVWQALAEGEDLPAAVERGRTRLEGVAEFDMQQAFAEATAKAQLRLEERSRPKWWERTLTGSENCALCIAASTRAYRVGELNPIHPGCDCGVQEHWTPVPTGTLHPDRLAEAYQALYDETGADSTSGDLLRDILVSHDELGTVLTRPRKSKTSAA